jgi:uncharacterized protein (DUF58 family)
VSPTPRAATLLAAIALVALVLPAALALLALIALVGAFLVDLRASRDQPRVAREVSGVLVRGQATELTVTVEGPGAGRALVRQAATPELELGAREGVGGLATTLTARRRGRHELPELAIRTEGPLGLARTYRTAEPPRTLDVYPDVPGARRFALAVRQGRFREQSGRATGPLGLGTDFESIRQYVPDDDIRRVNWRATARTGRPMSNQYRIEQEREVVCLVDCGRLMTAPSGAAHGATRLDVALDAAIAVGLVADAVGDRFGAIAFDQELQATLRPRRRGGESAVRALHALQPRPLDSDYELAMRNVGGSKRALVLVMTDFLDEVAARALVEAVPILARRHAVAVASSQDPDLDAALTTRPRQPLDVYAAAAALDMVQARDRAAAVVRRSGADVIEAAPGALAHACVRAYLRSKARALL